MLRRRRRLYHRVNPHTAVVAIPTKTAASSTDAQPNASVPTHSIRPFSWASGASCTGSPYVWTSANWSGKFTKTSDSAASVSPSSTVGLGRGVLGRTCSVYAMPAASSAENNAAPAIRVFSSLTTRTGPVPKWRLTRVPASAITPLPRRTSAMVCDRLTASAIMSGALTMAAAPLAS